jgi:hypothetical protein
VALSTSEEKGTENQVQNETKVMKRANEGVNI